MATLSKIRYPLAFLAFVSSLFGQIAFAHPDNTCAGSDAGVGEIRTSILSEQDFLKAYGDGDWALLDGRSLVSDSNPSNSLAGKAIIAYLPPELVDSNGSKRLPDARGRFLRMNNVGVTGEGRDPNADRHIGSLQDHLIEKHKHKAVYTNHRGTPEHTDTSRDEFGKVSGYRDTTETGGEETRPVNISVLYYIRIHKTPGLTCD